MAENTIVDSFGAGATYITSGTSAPTSGLLIPESTLLAMGLTTPATANGDKMTATVLKKIAAVNTLTAFEADLDKSIYVELQTPDFETREGSNNNYRYDTYEIRLYKVDDDSDINVNDY